MTITPRDHHHAEVTEPGLYSMWHMADRLDELTLELPDHLITLSPEEATRLRDALTAALTAETTSPETTSAA